MYLWKRKNGFTFQQRIPASVAFQFGTTPLRISLGPLSASEAKRRAIALSAAATSMMSDPLMNRETLVHSLRTLNDELRSLKTESFGVKARAMGLKQQAEDAMDEDEPGLAKYYEGERKRYVEKSKLLEQFKDRLESISTALAQDTVAWESERGTYNSVVQLLGAAGVQLNLQQVQQVQQTQQVQQHPSSQPNVEEVRDARTIEATTNLSVAGRIVLDARKEALKGGDNEKRRYEERLETSFAAFLEIVGDHPLSYYLPLHLQDFATAMGNVPTNRTKYEMFLGLSLKEMGEKNDSLPEKKRVKRLSQTTVKEYVAQVKLIWEKATAGVNGIRDLRSFNVTMPATAAPSVDREGLPIDSINKWFIDSVSPKIMQKPHKAWLPLVAYLTGMRLSEIVYLQSSDFVNIDGNEVIDLRLPLIINGEKVARPLKTKTSERIVALHPLLHECGFVDFAKKQRGLGGFVFPHFHSAKDPADAAQKQMSNWMVALEIHEPQRQVFHSLRHNAKSWLRIHLGDTLADRQCGHAAATVGSKYGFKALEPEEVEKVMAIPAPRGIDFSPFTNRFQS